MLSKVLDSGSDHDVCFLSTMYSLSAYIIDFEHINQSYKSSGILPVLSYSDHIYVLHGFL